MNANDSIPKQIIWRFLRETILVIVSVLAFSTYSYAQTDSPLTSNGGKRYRVTAFKLSNASLSSLSNVAEAIPNPTMYIPSAFTPNGDGVNDFFGVKAEGIKSFNLQIFNRWGEVVFESESITNLWDGSFKGERIKNTDVYVYQVKATGLNNKPLPEENGSVTLVAGDINEQ
jgi:gliding motility-associated-like protein